jgi:tripartite-type tricarboxylate transporter receptor subunit TctC
MKLVTPAAALLVAAASIAPAHAQNYWARAKKPPYDHVMDSAFVSMVGTTTNVIVTHPSLAMKNLRNVIAYARKHPGKLNYGSSGLGASPNLSVELLKLEAKFDIVHFPYKGAAVAMSDVISRHLELMTGNLQGPPPRIRAGKLRGLAVTSAKRSPQAPDMSTVAEQGVPGFDVWSWYEICTQAGVPKPVFDKLRADLLTAMASEDLQKRLIDQEVDPRTSTPEEFAAHVRAETARWARFVREAKIPSQ